MSKTFSFTPCQNCQTVSSLKVCKWIWFLFLPPCLQKISTSISWYQLPCRLVAPPCRTRCRRRAEATPIATWVQHPWHVVVQTPVGQPIFRDFPGILHGFSTDFTIYTLPKHCPEKPWYILVPGKKWNTFSVQTESSCQSPWQFPTLSVWLQMRKPKTARHLSPHLRNTNIFCSSLQPSATRCQKHSKTTKTPQWIWKHHKNINNMQIRAAREASNLASCRSRMTRRGNRSAGPLRFTRHFVSVC